MKNLFRVWSLSFLMLIFAAASAYAAPIISSAAINSTNQITISGTNLVYGATKLPTVVFNGARCSANAGATKYLITAQLTSTPAPGTYVLKVVNGYGTSPNFDVTYGAVGPQGPAGPAGSGGPLAGSSYYIQNNPDSPQAANLNITGSGTFGGNVTATGTIAGSNVYAGGTFAGGNVTVSGSITGNNITASGTITGDGSGLTNLNGSAIIGTIAAANVPVAATASGIPQASSDPATASAENAGNLYFNTASGTAKMSDGTAWREVRTGKEIGRLILSSNPYYTFTLAESTIPFDTADIIYSDHSDLPYADFGAYNHGFSLPTGPPAYYKIDASFALNYTGNYAIIRLYLDENVIRTYFSGYNSGTNTTFNVDDIISVSGAGINGGPYHTLYMTIQSDTGSTSYLYGGYNSWQTYWNIHRL